MEFFEALGNGTVWLGGQIADAGGAIGKGIADAFDNLDPTSGQQIHESPNDISAYSQKERNAARELVSRRYREDLDNVTLALYGPLDNIYQQLDTDARRSLYEQDEYEAPYASSLAKLDHLDILFAKDYLRPQVYGVAGDAGCEKFTAEFGEGYEGCGDNWLYEADMLRLMKEQRKIADDKKGEVGHGTDWLSPSMWLYHRTEGGHKAQDWFYGEEYGAGYVNWIMRKPQELLDAGLREAGLNDAADWHDKFTKSWEPKSWADQVMVWLPVNFRAPFKALEADFMLASKVETRSAFRNVMRKIGLRKDGPLVLRDIKPASLARAEARLTTDLAAAEERMAQISRQVDDLRAMHVDAIDAVKRDASLAQLRGELEAVEKEAAGMRQTQRVLKGIEGEVKGQEFKRYIGDVPAVMHQTAPLMDYLGSHEEHHFITDDYDKFIDGCKGPSENKDPDCEPNDDTTEAPPPKTPAKKRDRRRRDWSHDQVAADEPTTVPKPTHATVSVHNELSAGETALLKDKRAQSMQSKLTATPEHSMPWLLLASGILVYVIVSKR